MDILFLSHIYPSTYNTVYGIFVHKEIKALVSLGVNCKVISPVYWVPFPLNRISTKWQAYADNPGYAKIDEIEVYYPRYLDFPKALFFSTSGIRMYKGLQKLFFKLGSLDRFDLIHAHTALPDGLAGMKLAERFNIPLFVTIHGQDFQKTIYKNRLCRQKVNKVLNFAERIIVVSEKLKKIAKNEFGLTKKVKVVHNGINPDEIASGDIVETEDFIDRKVILSVSNLKKTKGNDFNIKAVSELIPDHPSLMYLVIGDGPYRNSLEDLTKSLKMENYVMFLGQLKHKKVMDYMQRCDIFSLPSWQEGFGVVYLEAMAHGKPVIACKGEGIDGVIIHEKTGLLVKPNSVSDLVKNLSKVLNQPEWARKIGNNAYKKVVPEFSWIESAKSLLSIYEEVI